MKIIHVITAFGIGGAEKLLLDIINIQIKTNEVHLIYLKKIDDLIPLLDKRVKVKNLELSLFLAKKMRSYFKSVNPDIIHTHLGHADLIGIWSSRNLKSRVFCTMHNIYFQRNLLDSVFFKIYKFLFFNAAKNIQVVSISKSVEQHVINTLKLPQNQSHLLYNAIPATLSAQRQNELRMSKPVIVDKQKVNLLFVGRLTKQKSVDTLLKSIKVLKDNGYGNSFELLIVGDGVLRTSLEKMAVQLGINNLVRFEGEQSLVENYYNVADVFILPSIWEGFGIVVLEAFRANVAVIASNLEGPSELINNNVNGILFEPTNYLELSDKISTLIKDSNFRQQLANEGYQTFSKKFQIDIYVQELTKLYERRH
ncbi:glycosyltransferase [Mariniflexile sp.]|uniref:glycosyltransferase n=1 Tax=Mariniflexile sp. TaxID=1979402 RepID=UPI003569FF0F